MKQVKYKYIPVLFGESLDMAICETGFFEATEYPGTIEQAHEWMTEFGYAKNQYHIIKISYRGLQSFLDNTLSKAQREYLNYAVETKEERS